MEEAKRIKLKGKKLSKKIVISYLLENPILYLQMKIFMHNLVNLMLSEVEHCGTPGLE